MAKVYQHGSTEISPSTIINNHQICQIHIREYKQAKINHETTNPAKVIHKVTVGTRFIHDSSVLVLIEIKVKLKTYLIRLTLKVNFVHRKVFFITHESMVLII